MANVPQLPDAGNPGRHLAEVLTLLLLHPDSEYSISDVASALGLPLTTVQRGVDHLSRAQWIRERGIGHSRLVSVDSGNRFTQPLTELITLAFGPRFVIREEFSSLGANAVAIYGAWAARYDGVAGQAPHDVDVLVVGEVPRRQLYGAAGRAGQRLELPVNPVLCSKARWFAASDPLVRQIRSAPIVWVAGGEPQADASLCAGAAATRRAGR